MRILILTVAAAVTLAGCGGGPMSVAFDPARTDVEVFPNTSGDVERALAWRGSPVDPSNAYINVPAIEPGEHWIGADGTAVISSVTWTAAETERFIPRVTFRYGGLARRNLAASAREELEASVRRAFKVWTRYLESDWIGERSGEFLVEVGASCGSDPGIIACAHAGGVLTTPTMYIPDSTATLVADGVSMSVFGVLAHEVGHMLGYDNSAYLPGIQPHAPSYTGQLMAPLHGDSTTVTPQYADVVGVGATYRYSREPVGADHFGWWIEPTDASNANLARFGVKVTRVLAVDEDLNGISTAQGIEADALVSDFIKVAAFVDGIPTGPDHIPRTSLGSARWEGVLLAVDTRGFQPVVGAAELVANLDVSSIRAAFNEFQAYDGLTGEFSDWREDSLSYTLRQVPGSEVWSDGRSIDARFFAKRESVLAPIDPAGLVSGRLNDARVEITGAFAAGRPARGAQTDSN